MRLDEVRAGAFGPFRNAVLDLAPGFNVVHGSNEAGKSSWFSAAYAGLAGRRKARGRGTLVQADFRNRHKPWSGSQWRVAVTVTLDSGVVLGIEHDLGKGESRIVDPSTGRVVPIAQLAGRLGMDLTTDGSLDGTRLLGLNRDSARATIFTGQADMLRVVDDAGELQEFLERAATSGVADATADGAIIWLGNLRSERVGSEHMGRKPLRARGETLAQKRQETSQRRDQLTRLLEVIAARQGINTQLLQAKEDVARADQLDRWTAIRSLQQRLRQAESLSTKINESAGTSTEIDENQIRSATMILGAYDAGTDVQPLPDGAGADELETEIAALPAPPQGDLEPRDEVLAARDNLTRAATALRTHIDGAPESAPAIGEIGASADELRTLADSLEAQPPVEEPGLAEELAILQQQAENLATAFRQDQERYEAALERNEQLRLAHAQEVAQHAMLTTQFESSETGYTVLRVTARQAAEAQAKSTRNRMFMVATAGILLLLAGVALAVIGNPAVGISVAVIGTAGAVVGLIAGRRAHSKVAATAGAEPPRPAPPQAPAPLHLDVVTAPVAPPADPRVMDLQIALKAQENTARRHDDQVAATRTRLLEQSLPVEPPALRSLARSMDDAQAAQERRHHHEERRQQLLRDRDRLARALAAELKEGIDDEISDDGVRRLIHSVETYVTGCRERTATAQLAARRGDLTSALEQRRRLETDRAAAAAERERQVTALREFLSGLHHPDFGADGPTDEAAQRLRTWLAQQQQARTQHAARAELTTRLDQLLESRALEHWQRELSELIGAAGPEPENLPADVDAHRHQVTTRHEHLVSRAGGLAGQQEQLSRELTSVAGAAEDEAAAERALAEVQTLRDCIDAAVAQLTLARDRAHANIAPALEAKVRPLLPRITGGRYLDVTVDPSDLNVKVTEVSGAIREARLLSHGTMEQIFLLLRIALAQVLSGAHEAAPLILDDVTVQSDQTRTLALLSILHELSAEHQVILFTQEQEVVDWATENLTGDRDRIADLTQSS